MMPWRRKKTDSNLELLQSHLAKAAPGSYDEHRAFSDGETIEANEEDDADRGDRNIGSESSPIVLFDRARDIMMF